MTSRVRFGLRGAGSCLPPGGPVAADGERPVAGPKRRRRSRGSTIIETALVLPLFLTVLLATFDVAYLSYVRSSLQHAIREAGRLAATSRTITVAGSTTPLSPLDSIVWMIHQQSGLNVASNKIQVSSVTSNGTMVTGPGGPGDVVTIRVQFLVNALTPIFANILPQGQYMADVSTSYRNEEF